MVCRASDQFTATKSGILNVSLKSASVPPLCVPKTLSVLIGGGNHLTSAHNDRAALFVLSVLVSPFKSKSRLEAENAALRYQVVVLRRKMRGRVRLTNNDRWFFIQLYRWFPSILQVITIIRPETLVRWHRAGFRRYWRWKSRSFGGRPQIDAELRALIRQMSIENPLWGAPRIHGELLKLGFDVAQSTVAKYMAKRRGPPSQGWRPRAKQHFSLPCAMKMVDNKRSTKCLLPLITWVFRSRPMHAISTTTTWRKNQRSNGC